MSFFAVAVLSLVCSMPAQAECSLDVTYPENVETRPWASSNPIVSQAKIHVREDGSASVTFPRPSDFTQWSSQPDTFPAHPVMRRLNRDTSARLVVVGRSRSAVVNGLRVTEPTFSEIHGSHYRRLMGEVPANEFETSQTALAMIVTDPAFMPQPPERIPSQDVDRGCIERTLRKTLHEHLSQDVRGLLTLESLGGSTDVSRWLISFQLGDKKVRSFHGRERQVVRQWIGIVDQHDSNLAVRYWFSTPGKKKNQPLWPMRLSGYIAVDRDGDGMGDIVFVNVGYVFDYENGELIKLGQGSIEIRHVQTVWD